MAGTLKTSDKAGLVAGNKWLTYCDVLPKFESRVNPQGSRKLALSHLKVLYYKSQLFSGFYGSKPDPELRASTIAS